MKKLLFTIIMMICIWLNAQNHITVYGNLGVENVNKSILNTEYGTSSDERGITLYRLIRLIGLK